jgi:hypothetical protein
MSRLFLTFQHFILFCLVSFSFKQAIGAIRPSNGASLNYTQIMFEYDEVAGSEDYVISIFMITEKENIPVNLIHNTSLACLISDFQFGKSYSWHYEAFKDKKSVFKSEDFRFSISPSYLVDSVLFRSIVNRSQPGAFHNDILFLDYRGIAIDRQGKPVWYYPFNAANKETDPNFRNLCMTNEGSITLLNDSNCYEIDIDAKQLWKAPNDGKISGEGKEFYHHDFKKLDDGTYLTSSYKFEMEPNFYNTSIFSKVRYNTLIQYDATGNVIWHWNEKDHIDKEIIFGVYGPADTSIAGTHLNAFDYDAREDAIIMGCRHNSSIVKIDRKTGNIIYIIGPYGNKQKLLGLTPLFLHQHGMAILPDHKILFYDNNVNDDPGRAITYPRIMILKEPANGIPAYKVWEFECRSDRFPKGIMGKGGSAMPLPNGNILACMGGANYVFEITTGKEIVWECSFEKFNPGTKTWSEFVNYRCNYASSLYPRYFTLQHIAGKKSGVSVKLNNEGSEDDTYQVDVRSMDEKKIIFTKTIDVKNRSARVIDFSLKTKFSKKGFKILVTPLSNRLASKYLVFPASN